MCAYAIHVGECRCVCVCVCVFVCVQMCTALLFHSRLHWNFLSTGVSCVLMVS